MIVSTTLLLKKCIFNSPSPTHAVVTVSFKGDEVIQFVNEELSSTQVCLTLSHTELQRQITVTVSTEEGTASGN